MKSPVRCRFGPNELAYFKSPSIPCIQGKINLSMHPIGGTMYLYNHFGNKWMLCGKVEDMQTFQPCD